MAVTIPLKYFLDEIPKVDISEKGIKFLTLYNRFHELGLSGCRNRNKVRDDLLQYCKLGYFIRKQNGNGQPQYYQTNVNEYDFVNEYLNPILNEKFKSIQEKWTKLDKGKLFLKTRKKDELSKPSKKLEIWITEFDSIIVIIQNLLWTRETTKDEITIKKYSGIIQDTMSKLNQFAKLVYSANKENKRAVKVVFARMPFRMTF